MVQAETVLRTRKDLKSIFSYLYTERTKPPRSEKTNPSEEYIPDSSKELGIEKTLIANEKNNSNIKKIVDESYLDMSSQKPINPAYEQPNAPLQPETIKGTDFSNQEAYIDEYTQEVKVTYIVKYKTVGELLKDMTPLREAIEIGKQGAPTHWKKPK